MPSIESLGYPLVYRLPPGLAGSPPEAPGGRLGTRVKARALEGMQKEALVFDLETDSGWRMVSDEGPYLNGTDLAPFPLAFFASGMALSYLEQVLRLARVEGIELDSLSLVQHNTYTMQGSALRGDMIGGGQPVELWVEVRARGSAGRLAAILRRAEARCPAHAYMRDVLENTFHLVHNGRPLIVERLRTTASGPHPDPAPDFEAAAPDPGVDLHAAIIKKVKAAEALEGIEGGAGSSLQAEQKRTLHVLSNARLRADGSLEAEVALLKPLGSTFRFRADARGTAAPPALAYLTAGIGFCYLTQLGRYAHIVKLDLRDYRIVQDSLFGTQPSDRSAGRAVASPVETHLYLSLNDGAEAAERVLWMGERTCFLHASMRGSYPSEIRARINGDEFDLEALESSLTHGVQPHAS